MIRGHDRQLLLMALVVLGATSIAAMQVPGARSLADTVGRALTPVERTLTGGANKVVGAVTSAQELEELRVRAAELERENAELTSQNVKVAELVRENRQLRDELNFARERVDLDLMGASIIGVKVAEEPGNLRRTIKLDIGTSDGVKQWQPVANHVGLIGQITHAAPHWSDVLLMTDPASRVQARIERSRETGVVFGSTTGEMVMRFIRQNHGDEDPVVQVNDLVYTSGLSQRFPPMLLIGQVVEVRQSDEQTHQEAIVRPAVDFGAVETALVVRDWIPVAGSEPIGPAEADSDQGDQ